jgi:hypothetical protein
MAFVKDTPLSLICDLSAERGVGDKKLLRSLALKLGLEQTSKFAKRAIQFGSRVAKVPNFSGRSSKQRRKAGNNEFHLSDFE